MKNKRTWFTLVELIVVITILAILWTIAFISLQWYSSDARNSKRINNLWNITKAIIFKNLEWVKLESFIKDRSNTLSWHTYWWVESILWFDYDAWTINYDAIWINELDFLDPNWNKYIIWMSTKLLWSFDIAASLESGWWYIAKIVWNYNPRKAISTSSTISTWVGESIVFLTKNNWLKQWDTIVTDWLVPSTLIVTWLSTQNSWHRISLDWIVPLDATNIRLISDDSEWLIADKNDETKAVVEWWISLAY